MYILSITNYIITITYPKGDSEGEVSTTNLLKFAMQYFGHNDLLKGYRRYLFIYRKYVTIHDLLLKSTAVANYISVVIVVY